MRILLPTMRDPGQIGGTSTHISMLSRGLEDLGHTVDALYVGGAVPAPVRQAGLVWPAGALNRVRKGWGMVYSAETRARLLARATAAEIERAARAGSPWEVLNAQEVYSVPYLRGVADEYGLPLVLTLHGYPLYESVSEGYSSASQLGRNYLMRAEMRALRLADAVVTVDTRLYRHALRLVPERTDSVYTLMNFIDTSAFAPDPDPAVEQRLRDELRAELGVPRGTIVLFCPRRLVKKNGVVYPSLALATMAPGERTRFLLLHAGEGGERAEIERIVAENHLDENVRLLGGQDPDAIRRALPAVGYRAGALRAFRERRRGDLALRPRGHGFRAPADRGRRRWTGRDGGRRRERPSRAGRRRSARRRPSCGWPPPPNWARVLPRMRATTWSRSTLTYGPRPPTSRCTSVPGEH